MDETEEQSISRHNLRPEMAIPLSLSSLSQSTSYLSSLDVVLFCVVLLLTLSFGVIHTFLITRKLNRLNTKNSKEHEYDQVQTRSRRGSETSNISSRNSTLDTNGDEIGGKTGKETNGGIEGKHRDSKDDEMLRVSAGTFHNGLGLIQSTNSVGGSSAGTNIDIMFQLICFASIIITIGLPMYSYLHGPSLTISIFPAMLAAHVTSIFIVIPFVKRYRRKMLKKDMLKHKKEKLHNNNSNGIFLVRYLIKRFGGIDNHSSHQDVNRTEILHQMSSTNTSHKIFSILIWTLIFILWGFITVSKLQIVHMVNIHNHNIFTNK